MKQNPITESRLLSTAQWNLNRRNENRIPDLTSEKPRINTAKTWVGPWKQMEAAQYNDELRLNAYLNLRSTNWANCLMTVY